jgi:hypothetical protein
LRVTGAGAVGGLAGGVGLAEARATWQGRRVCQIGPGVAVRPRTTVVIPLTRSLRDHPLPCGERGRRPGVK